MLATKAAATSLQENLCFKSVVPKKKVDDKLSRLEDKVHDIFCQAMKAGRDTDAVLQFVGDLHLAMRGFRDGMTTDALDVNEERQMNSWVNKLLAPILHSHGFKEKESFQDNKFSVFGTTRPDFAFFKNSQKQLIVMVDENGSELTNFEGNIVQNVIEYKNKDITKHFCQVYANMIRIANDSTIDCLPRGVLVDSVTVYALLVS